MANLTRAFSLALFILVISSATQAQTPYEASAREIVLPNLPCDGSTRGSFSVPLPGDLSSPALVTGIKVANQNPFGSGGGLWYVFFDRQGTYAKASGWPYEQNGAFYSTMPLLYMPIGTGLDQAREEKFKTPFVWRPGDSIDFENDCSGITGGVGPMLAIELAEPYGSPSTPAVNESPAPWLLLFATGITGDNPGGPTAISLRMVTPPLLVNITQIQGAFRAGSGTGANVSHVSVGISNGSGSGTFATPVELTFGGASGFSAAPNTMPVSDTTNFTASAGNALVFVIDLTSGDLAYNSSGGDSYIGAGSTWNQASPSGMAGPTTYNYGLLGAMGH